MSIPTKDERFQIGDLVRTYHKGFHRVISICHQLGEDQAGTLLIYKQEFTEEGKPIKGQEYQCHASYCTLVDQACIDTLVSRYQRVVDQLKKIPIMTRKFPSIWE